MKKIMFNDKYGLTDAVLCGRKTMTRRIVPDGTPIGNCDETVRHARYQVGEVVAIAQSYKDAGYSKEWVMWNIKLNPNTKPTEPFEKKYPGWSNKMFVKAEFMPNFIQFTDLKVERLQEISDEDCIREGVKQWTNFTYCVDGIDNEFIEPREAFATLIDKVSGRGTWERNPWVFVYTFEILKEGGEK